MPTTEQKRESIVERVYKGGSTTVINLIIYGIYSAAAIGMESVVILYIGKILGLTTFGILAQFGAITGGLSVIVMPHKKIPLWTLQWYLAFAFVAIEWFVIGSNVIVAFNSIRGAQLSDIETLWSNLLPASAILVMVGWGLIFQSDPGRRAETAKLAAKLARTIAEAEEEADLVDMELRSKQISMNRQLAAQQHEALIEEKYAQFYVEAVKDDEEVNQELRKGAKDHARKASQKRAGQFGVQINLNGHSGSQGGQGQSQDGKGRNGNQESSKAQPVPQGQSQPRTLSAPAITTLVNSQSQSQMPLPKPLQPVANTETVVASVDMTTLEKDAKEIITRALGQALEYNLLNKVDYDNLTIYVNDKSKRTQETRQRLFQLLARAKSQLSESHYNTVYTWLKSETFS